MPDNDPTFEPLLSKSLCNALLDISKYAAENADQTIRARPWFDDVLVEALKQPEGTQPEPAQPESPFAPAVVPSGPTTMKTWKLPLAWWPKKALPDEFAKLLTFTSLNAALVQLRDEQSAFSVYVQRCLAADSPNLFGASEAFLRFSAVGSNQSDGSPPGAPSQEPG